MPFQSNSDVPADVKRRFSGHCRTVWRTVWNDTFERHHDEGRAFATAEQAGKQCKESNVGEKTMAVKFADGSDDIIEGYGVPFGMDIEGESFTAKTDLCLDWFPNGGRPILYDHGFDGKVQFAAIGHELSSEMTSDGLWVKAQLDKANKYYSIITPLIEAGAVGWSSGAPESRVKMGKGGVYDRWPPVEFSLTTIPAKPNRVGYAVKSADVIEHLAAVDAEVPASLNESVEHGTVRLSIDAEQEAGPVPDLPERIEAVSVEVRAYLDQTVKHAQVRAKAGRVLSKANRQRLAQHLTLIEELRKDLAELYEATDPERESRAKAATDAYYRTLAATYGAQVNPEVPT